MLTQPSQDGWYLAETLDFTGASFRQAKPEIERVIKHYEDQGKRVKVVAKSIVEIMVASDV